MHPCYMYIQCRWASCIVSTYAEVWKALSGALLSAAHTVHFDIDLASSMQSTWAKFAHLHLSDAETR